MKVVVTFAVDAEFAPWRRLQRFERIKERDAVIFRMRSREAEVHTVLTGIGAQRATPHLKELLKTADVCIVSGLVGSLNKPHGVGSVLVARNVRRDSGDRSIRSDESLVKAAIECGAAPVDTLCTTAGVVTSASAKVRLSSIADAVDMETFQLMTEAEKSGVSAVPVRAVSDAADQNLPLDFNQAINAAGNIEWLPVMSQVAASPRCLPQLLRFGLQSSKAARKLATFLDRYLKCLIAEAHCHVTGTGMEVR